MNKALRNRNDGQKKPPHHVGEDRDGVYGKENRVTTGNVSCYYSINSTMSFFSSALRRAVAPFVVHVSHLKPLAARALTGDTSGCESWLFKPGGQPVLAPFFLPERALRFHQISLR